MAVIKRHIFKGLKHDTCWDIAGSPDGYIYVGACMEHTPGGIAVLVQFNPRKEKLRYIANLDRVTGEVYGDTHAPQGKIHFSLCPMNDGIIYGSTHCTTPPAMDRMWDPWAMFSDDKRSFRGAHFYRYDPKNDDIQDYGIIVLHEGVSVMMFDEDVERFFAGSFPRAHLYSWDKKGRDIIDFGRVSEHYILSFAKYDKQTIFFSDYYGRLLILNPEKMNFDFTGYKLPHQEYNDGMRNWMAHSVAGPDGWIYAGMYSYPNIIRFRPVEGKIEIEDLGKGIDGNIKEKAIDFAYSRGMPLGFILKETKLYYVQLVYLGPKEFVGGYVSSYDINSGEKEMICRLELDEFRPLVWVGALGIDGNLYWADFDVVPPSLWSVSL